TTLTGVAGGPPATPVKVVPVARETVIETLTAVGTLRANESVLIRPEIAGRIQTIHFREGEPIAAGAPLVTLDPAEYKAQVAGSQADVTLSELNFERQRNLDRSRLASQQDLDNARAKLDQARAQLDLDRVRLDKTVIHAPFAGTVGLRAVSPGAYVSPGQDIARLDSLNPIKLDFRVPEVQLARLKVGQPVAVRIDAYAERDFRGEILAIDPTLDEITRTVLVRARLANAEGLLRPGVFARVQLEIARREQALVIPEEAIWPVGRQTLVYVVKDGRAESVPVELGLRQAGKVEVKNGLAADAQVVTDGQMKLRPGAAVKIAEPAAPPAAGARQGG
ncbi:MAG TPA: efflux RND transporter periplasmic adaptor subunit, partial [Plasticicumulans sp.]|nr:efflux RND transporter periplasmic adaptor subunit [Plasticicumulans sp.]